MGQCDVGFAAPSLVFGFLAIEVDAGVAQVLGPCAAVGLPQQRVALLAGQYEVVGQSVMEHGADGTASAAFLFRAGGWKHLRRRFQAPYSRSGHSFPMDHAVRSGISPFAIRPRTRFGTVVHGMTTSGLEGSSM